MHAAAAHGIWDVSTCSHRPMLRAQIASNNIYRFANDPSAFNDYRRKVCKHSHPLYVSRGLAAAAEELAAAAIQSWSAGCAVLWAWLVDLSDVTPIAGLHSVLGSLTTRRERVLASEFARARRAARTRCVAVARRYAVLYLPVYAVSMHEWGSRKACAAQRI